MWEIPCCRVFFNEISRISSGLATLAKKGIHQGGLPVNVLELHRFFMNFLHKLRFFDKNEGLCTTGLQLYQDAGQLQTFFSKYYF